MPTKLERCVKQLIDEGYEEQSAYAICTASIEKAQNKTFSDYPQAVRDAAERGIKLNEAVGNRCATQVGKVRAQQLVKGEALSLDTIKRMYSYLSRAATYYKPKDTEACGTISYLLWGGEPALRWTERVLKSEGEIE
jgi:hypothetical protein